jgi:hypothetical protein
MWHRNCLNTSPIGDRDASGEKRRTRNAEDQAYEAVEPPRKQQRVSYDTVGAPSPKKDSEKSMGATKKAKESVYTSAPLPECFSADDERQDQAVVSVPGLEDSDNEVLSKLTAILNVVRAGGSIAKATAYSATPNYHSDAETVAKSQMPPQEHEAWTTFNDGLWALPELDWDNNKLPPPTSAKSLKVARRRAEALNRLYKTDRAAEGHVVWITENKIELLPLIKAMARIIGAEINRVGGGKWSAIQLADLQSVNRIISVSAQICQKSISKVLRTKVAEVLHALESYRRQLQTSNSEKPASIETSGEGWNEDVGKLRNDTQNQMPFQFQVKKGLQRMWPSTPSSAF